MKLSFRSKSKSLSQLLQANYPLGSNLCRSSSNLLTASQPTQVTDVEDPSTLNDLVLDESMFEQSIPGTPSHDRSLDTHSHNKRRVINKKGTRTGRRASEGALVVPTTMTKSTSVKSILKESRSVNENLNEPGMRGSSAVSDVSSEVTHSDDNSLHLRKSVRFNVEEWAEDSGVHTGTSTPHYTPYPSLKRRASEPETFGSHYSNGERRGSAPGDLASQTEIDTEEGEGVNVGGVDGGVDEGMAVSKQWGQQENDIDFEKGKVEKRFEGIFSSEHEVDAETQNKTRAPRTDAVMSHNIASRVAQLYSSAQKTPRPSVSFTRGPSSLATSSYDSATISVAEVKKMLLERKDRQDGVTGGVGNEEGRRPGVSKLPQERVKVFRTPTERLRTASLDRAQLRRGKPLNIGAYQALREGLRPMKEKVSTEKVTPPKYMPKQEKKKESKATSSNPGSGPAPAPVAIPVFSGHSNLSNWVPACLRETVISPYHSYDDDDNEPGITEEEEGESDSSDDRDIIMMEPLEPTVGTPLTSTGSIPAFGGVATMTPIGRSWLSSPNRTFGSSRIALPTKPIIPGGKDISPFNESMHLQRGGHLLGAIKRLSVIPEETTSACSSVTSMYTEQ
ncbi:hypothetical protein GBAR_LOCUS18967 [Geodia barretti]|uniref:Uncharacterized protein n=1 Tax=Geodia barretti TaxID=519541 RepID=A0AA35SP09_GEOBA|nr:hypothetical protein GBAR_LOCUS18967 [Geodia barretti]